MKEVLVKHYAYSENGHIWVQGTGFKKDRKTCSKCGKVRRQDQAKKVPKCKVPASPVLFGSS